ncbi:Casein kinase II subunit alpha [Dinochytrium kinnereticum]|nr:Casein kinase II subunit alpha [Dinochytrium kinnereticum]
MSGRSSRMSLSIYDALNLVVQSVSEATTSVISMTEDLINGTHRSPKKLSGIGVARVHARAVIDKPSSYSDWENSTVEYRFGIFHLKDILLTIVDSDLQYDKGIMLGRGKYSHVFECIDRKTTNSYVVKVFKPQKTKKYKREVLVLKNLQGGPNIVRFVGCCMDPENNEPAIIFERRVNINWKEYYPTMTYNDIRHYIHALLRALSYAHSQGIIHRDLKPQNICIDPSRKELVLIDWGLADFYRPNQDFNLRVASRYYKPPEILLGYRKYDYSFDMWSVGCILAGMIFRREVFFQGEDDVDQLRAIVRVLGGDDLRAYVAKYAISLSCEPVQSIVETSTFTELTFNQMVLTLKAAYCQIWLEHIHLRQPKSRRKRRRRKGETLYAYPSSESPHTILHDPRYFRDFTLRLKSKSNPQPAFFINKLLRDDEETEVEVRREDQSNINAFARMNQRMTDLEETMEAKKKEKEYLDDLEGELELQDEDEPVKYKIGDAFFDLSLTDCQERLKQDQEVISKEVEEIEKEMEKLKGGMDELKKVLYARFGKSINLEK